MKIVLLLGPSSAGKTTLCSELQSAHKWKVINSDDVMDQIYLSESESFKKELVAAGLIQALDPYMTEAEVIRFCQNGLLNISKGEHLLPKYQASNASCPNIEEALKKVGFSESDTTSVAKLLRDVGKVHLQHKFPDLMEKIFDDAFSGKYEHDFLVLDLVPAAKDSAPLLQQFNSRVEKYREEHHSPETESFIVLAYTTPKKLSDRIHQRNVEAEQSGNPRNKREGLFPFDQLAGLVKSSESSQSTTSKILGSVSKAELLKIAYQHDRRKPDEETGSINRFKKRFRKAAHEYVRLSRDMDMPRDNKAESGLIIRENLNFDAAIETTEGTAQQLAVKLVSEIQSVRAVRKELSKQHLRDERVEQALPSSTQIDKGAQDDGSHVPKKR